MSENDDPDTSGGLSSRATSLSTINGWWWIAAAFILAVIIAVILIIVLPSNKNTATGPTQNGAPPPTTSTTTLSSPMPSPSSSGTGWADLGCNNTKGSEADPVLPPKVSWEPVGALSAPASGTLGPRKKSGFLRTCYQHTPAGAVVAASNVVIIGRTVPSDQRAAVLSKMITPGSGRDETIAGGTPANTDLRFAAFHIQSCAPERCNIQLITAVGSSYGYGDLSMVWSNGDWLLDGAQSPTGGPMNTVPPGYTEWGS